MHNPLFVAVIGLSAAAVLSVIIRQFNNYASGKNSPLRLVENRPVLAVIVSAAGAACGSSLIVLILGWSLIYILYFTILFLICGMITNLEFGVVDT